MSTTATVQDNPAEDRYEIYADGTLAGSLTYRREGALTVLLHTEVSPDFGGRGLGGTLVSYALDDLRAQGVKVESLCSYVDSYIAKHPEYADLLA